MPRIFMAEASERLAGGCRRRGKVSDEEGVAVEDVEARRHLVDRHRLRVRQLAAHVLPLKATVGA